MVFMCQLIQRSFLSFLVKKKEKKEEEQVTCLNEKNKNQMKKIK